MAQKPVLPRVILFVCESCQGRYSANYVREHKGSCGHCHGDSWTLKIAFTRPRKQFYEYFGVLGVAARLIFGSEDWDESQQYDFDFPGVCADNAFKICQVPYREQYRVLEYIKYRQQLDAEQQREAMIDRGGQVCSQCGALFVPIEDKPWTQAGYCSKVCFSQAFADFSQGHE